MCDIPHLRKRPLRHRKAAHRLIGVALLALLLGQWVLLAHSTAHARMPADAAVSADADDAFGHRAGTPACQLIDHLLLGQSAGGEASSVPSLPAAAMRVAVSAPSIGAGTAKHSYEARGPPRA